MQLSFIIGYGASMLPFFKKILSEEAKKFGFKYLALNDHSSERYAKEISKSDAVFIYAYEIPEKVEDCIKESKAKIVVSATENYVHLSRGSLDTLNKAVTYFKVGGEKNIRNLIRFLLNKLGLDVDFEDVKEEPWHGIFHPNLGTFEKTEDYLAIYNKKPLVGLLIHRNYWLYKNLQHLNAIVDAFEAEGLGVLPTFTYGLRDELLDTPSKEDTIREFFICNGRVVVDAVVNLTYFFLLDHAEFGKCKVNGLDLLKTLKVPIIQPCFSSSKSVAEWSESQGLDYLSQVYTVIMPEVDGLIEPIFIAGSKMSGDVKYFEPYKEHARYIAKRVKKWIELRKKSPEERRIAIVLINPPCKGLESSVAVGFGLDVPESVVRLLKRLKNSGYKVENVPENGDELIKTILSRKAISEFRWTCVEEVVEKGGAVGFVDLETYTKWFNELPNEAKEEIIKEWGKPEDVLSGKVNKELAGMVYQSKFVIPGLTFGNVAVIPQPKFGCAGSRCDGSVCKILHNPTIPPPHQWIAVYRWITRIFKADVVVHFGTHGYLEFRPGKSVGLSTACWPEISIDDVPHVYVYNVSNPMEGVIAKRRSYATIVDHMYPPMIMADVLDEIDALLSQYSKAKQLGDFERAEIVYNKLLEKAGENNIEIKGEDVEEVIEYLHSYVSAIRETQIEFGLHVFANPRTDKLAEYVATVMAHDTHEFRSIRRVLAEYVGLDYDEIKSNPGKVNRFGLTNSETIKILHEVAVEVIQELLVKPDSKVEDVIKLVDKHLSKRLGGFVHV